MTDPCNLAKTWLELIMVFWSNIDISYLFCKTPECLWDHRPKNLALKLHKKCEYACT